MADAIGIAKYLFKCEITYINTIKNKSLKIENNSIKSLKIDHNYVSNNMPIILLTISLNKKIIDDMIKNSNENLFNLSIVKYNELSNFPLEVTYFRDKFTYFLPDKLDANYEIDYATEEQEKQGNLKTITIGLMAINHINNNKKNCSMTINNTTKYDYVKYITSHIKDILIEPFNYNETLNNFVIPSIDSISKLLKYINDYRVFYKTPYRYYIDFDCTYIISSSGKAITKKSDKYDSVSINIKNIMNEEANDEGMRINKTKGNHTIVVSYVDAEVYDNSISNKSKTEIKGITSTEVTTTSLKSKSSISTSKTKTVKINNDNKHMVENIVADENSSNVFVAISKDDVDPSVFTINKKYTISHIDKYKDKDGIYLLTRKIEQYDRTKDNTYEITVALYFRKID